MKASAPVRYADFVWHRLRKIPPGQTLPYGEVAASIGSPGGARAVGGRLTGLASGLGLKTRLLKMKNPAGTLIR